MDSGTQGNSAHDTQCKLSFGVYPFSLRHLGDCRKNQCGNDFTLLT